MRIGAALALVLLAACLGSAPPIHETPTEPPPGSSSVVVAGDVPDAVGTIEVLVLTEEEIPLADVRVWIAKFDADALTDDAGRASFHAVPAGDHDVAAHFEGFLPVQRTVRVEADATASIEFRLAAAPTTVPRSTLTTERLFLSCGFGLQQTTNGCAAFVGGERLSAIIPAEHGLTTVVHSAAWTPGLTLPTPGGSWLRFYSVMPNRVRGIEWYGAAPQTSRTMELGSNETVFVSHTGNWTFYGTYGGGSAQNLFQDASLLVFQQELTLYVTFGYYGWVQPEGYTGLP